MMHAAKLSRSNRLQRVHRLLRDGRERSTLEIVEGARVCAVNAVIAELRANGAQITCRQIHNPATGARLWLYRLVRAAPEATKTTEITKTTGTNGTEERETAE